MYDRITDVPQTRAGLKACHHLHEAISQLVTQTGASGAERLAMRIFVGAAIHLMPPWASVMVGKELTRFAHGWD